MTGQVRHLLNRKGRYFARLVVPRDLRGHLEGKTELRTALGPDYRTALRLLPGAVVELQHQIALAECRAAQAGAITVQPGRYPLAIGQIAARNYTARLLQDEGARNLSAHYSGVDVDDLFVDQLRAGIAGTLSNDVLAGLVEHRIDRYRQASNTTAVFGSEDWRALARAICISEYEALERVVERDRGDFTGAPRHPILTDAVEPEDPLPPLSLCDLSDAYVATRRLVGGKESSFARQRPVVESLIAFVRHDDARRLTKAHILAWRDHLLTSLAARTVSTVYLSYVKTLLKWAVENDKLTENVAETVRQGFRKAPLTRERGYTDAEGTAVLKFSRSYTPNVDPNGTVREHATLTAAKRWVPLLCAFTGARVAEMTQLRKEDIRMEGDVHVLRITADAGAVKAGGYRDVPLHVQIVDASFLDFVKDSNDGPIFYRPGKSSADSLKAAKRIASGLATWLSRTKLVPADLQPSHAWRHRFKTTGRELGLSDRVIDAICGHAGRTAGDDYGDVTIKAKHRAILKFPRYLI